LTTCMLVAVAEAVWSTECERSFPGGFRLPVRMTVVRLPGGSLLLHAPVPISDALAAEIDALGCVRYVVAPNCLHHLYLTACLQRYPAANAHVPPGLRKKRPDLPPASVLGSGPPPPWAEAVEPAPIAGAPLLNEFAFFHRPSASLLVTDLLFNVTGERNWATALVLGLMGTNRGLAMSRSWRLFAKDRRALKASLERVLDWPFVRILPGHGAVCGSSDAHERARSAFGWALRAD
jgi:hypothetical protein